MELLKYIFNSKYRKYKKFKQEIKRKWPKTKIIPKNRISLENITFGKYSYGAPTILRYGNTGEGLEIGNYVSIANNVTFLLGGEHNLETFTTYPLKGMILDREERMVTQKTIIEDDVWIGYGVKILSGVKIGQGAVIGAGAVVVRDLEPYGIYGGVPAKLIRYRFSKELRDKLLKLDLSKIEDIDLEENIELFYEKLTLERLDEIIRKLDEGKKENE